MRRKELKDTLENGCNRFKLDIIDQKIMLINFEGSRNPRKQQKFKPKLIPPSFGNDFCYFKGFYCLQHYQNIYQFLHIDHYVVSNVI